MQLVGVPIHPKSANVRELVLDVPTGKDAPIERIRARRAASRSHTPSPST
jgi:hypothetical protein